MFGVKRTKNHQDSVRLRSGIRKNGTMPDSQMQLRRKAFYLFRGEGIHQEDESVSGNRAGVASDAPLGNEGGQKIAQDHAPSNWDYSFALRYFPDGAPDDLAEEGNCVLPFNPWGRVIYF
jgi:hypothetical protein